MAERARGNGTNSRNRRIVFTSHFNMDDVGKECQLIAREAEISLRFFRCWGTMNLWIRARMGVEEERVLDDRVE
ncbi:hypothetical protein PSHT_02225 [Puccinia striiformis]|uniref:Uncharacterized protein n=1 Tax=Puccinia striiformis TaxID=27350 RepID=A0A2S4WIH4_9BASI|nr:hypothetical protein PSHT_02225 [Puccinia striiformis]